MNFGFCGPTYRRGAQQERCINFFPEFVETGNPKSKIELRSTPGLSVFTTLPASPVRALWPGDARLFAVAGTGYYEVLNTGVAELRGVVASDNYPAQILSNGDQLLVLSGGKVYCDNGGAASGANAAYQHDATWATYIDGYYVTLKPNSNQFYISELRNGLAWDELDFATKEGAPDRLVALVASHGHLWLFGKRTTEVWYHSGAASFPFERVPGGNIEQGAAALYAIADVDESLFFAVEDDRGGIRVCRTQGLRIERVSTHAIEQALSSFPSTGLLGYGYEMEGHKFYVLSAFGGDFTWVYDCATRMWHEWLYWDGAQFTAHLGRCHAYTTDGYLLGARHFLGARNSGKIYELSPNVFTDDGAAIRRYRQAPVIAEENRPVFHHSLELDVVSSGVTAANTTLAWSNGDLATWTAEKSPRPVAVGTGKLRRVMWPRLGYARERIYRVTMHNVAAHISITNAYLRASLGS